MGGVIAAGSHPALEPEVVYTMEQWQQHRTLPAGPSYAREPINSSSDSSPGADTCYAPDGDGQDDDAWFPDMVEPLLQQAPGQP